MSDNPVKSAPPRPRDVIAQLEMELRNMTLLIVKLRAERALAERERDALARIAANRAARIVELEQSRAAITTHHVG